MWEIPQFVLKCFPGDSASFSIHLLENQKGLDWETFCEAKQTIRSLLPPPLEKKFMPLSYPGVLRPVGINVHYVCRHKVGGTNYFMLPLEMRPDYEGESGMQPRDSCRPLT